MDHKCERVHDLYLTLHELQPAPLQYHQQYHGLQTDTSMAPAYELTAAGGVAGIGTVGAMGPVVADATCAEVAAMAVHAQHRQMAPSMAQHHDLSHRKTSYNNPEGHEAVACKTSLHSVPVSGSSSSRKRKTSSFTSDSVYDGDCGDDSRSSRNAPDKKQNHSEIEKRRRDKMNTYISELSTIVPMCGAMARKLDKLTVLRMAVQHLQSVRGALSACPLSAKPGPAYLSERELNALILSAAQDCFLLVVGCDRGRLLYVSASVKKMLNCEQSELVGQSLFDILHPKDVAKVKEQLSSSDISPRERLIDAKTMLPVKTDFVSGASPLCPGARRSFFCRIKCRTNTENTPTKETENCKLRKKSDKKYCVVQCTGYLKSWTPAEVSEAGGSTDGGDDGEDNNMSCLVAVCRALSDLVPAPLTSPRVPITRRLQFVSRLAIDGKFVFVDQRVTLALGFLPQELLGTSLYEYVSGPELSAVARIHKAALMQRDSLITPPYSFRKKDGTLTRIQTHFKPFKNPWTKDMEHLVANNTVVMDSSSQPNVQDSTFNVFNSKADFEMQLLIQSQVESHKIGNAIAEETLTRPASEFCPELPADFVPDIAFGQQTSLLDNILSADISEHSQVRNNVTLSAAGGQNSPALAEGNGLAMGTPPPASPPQPILGLDSNVEASMAVIMSLLEADAGLGGPVNFSGLPWPLP